MGKAECAARYKKKLYQTEEGRERVRRQARESMARFRSTPEGRERANAAVRRTMRKASDWKIELFEIQLGFCALCNQPMKFDSRRLHVDHDNTCHSRWNGNAFTSKCLCIRGLVHNKCNTGEISHIEKFWRAGDIQLLSEHLHRYFALELGPFAK
jgi:hypothetical protein